METEDHVLLFFGRHWLVKQLCKAANIDHNKPIASDTALPKHPYGKESFDRKELVDSTEFEVDVGFNYPSAADYIMGSRLA